MIHKLLSLKKLSAFLSLIVLLLSPGLGWGQATLPHLDPLNYTVGQGLQIQTGWTALNSGDDLLITSGNLSYTGLPASSGNMVTFDGTGIDAAKLFTQQASGIVYYSFLLNVTALGSLNTTGGYFTGFNEGTSTSYGATVWTRSDGSGFDIGINPRTTAANTVWTTGTTSINSTLFIVISYQIVSGSTNDVVKLWVNPVLGGTEPTATLTATNTLTDLANVNRIILRQDAATTTPFIAMDELRIGTTWADVTPTSGVVTAPTTQSSSIVFSSITSTSFTAGWTTGNGANRAVFIKQANTGTAVPVDNTTYTASTAFGSGTQIGSSGWFCVYNGTGTSVGISGLSASTDYIVHVCEYNGTAGNEKYNITSATNNPLTQTTSSGATAPIVTTPTASAIAVTSATLGGNVTSDGGSAITERGTVWSLSSPVTISDNKLAEGGTTTGVFTHSRTSLPSGTSIHYAAYATNAVGTTLSSESSFTTLVPEPTNHATALSASTNSSSQITVSWTDATGGQAPTAYLVKAAISPATPAAPVDGTAETDATLVKNIAQGVQQAVFTGLNASTTYNFSIWPYTNTEVNVNYKTDGTVPSGSATTAAPAGYTWDGGAGTSNWNDATNWSADVVPGNSDNVLLDNSVVTDSYSILLPTGNVQVKINKLTITPSASKTITVTLPSGNTYGASNDAGFVVGDNASSTDDIIINSGGILVNGSGGTAGNGIQVNALANGTCRINNGGKYVHNTARSTAGIVPLLSTASGTETGIFEYDSPGTGSSSISTSGRTYGSLTLTRTAGAATYTASGSSALTIKGNFLINPGVTYTSSMSGAMNIAGDVTFNGTALTIPAGQAVNFNGSSVQTISGTSNIALPGAVNIASGSVVNIASNMGVTVSGTLTNSNGNAGLVVKSGGSLIESSGVAATVESAIPASEWHLISSPVSNAVSGLFLGRYLQWFNEADNSYHDIASLTEPLTPVKGFVLWGGEGFTAQYAGNLNTGSINFTVTRTLAGIDYGYNLVGNPYPSSINWDASSGWDKASVNDALYIHVNNATWASYVPGLGTNGGTNYIAPGQGFFVQAKEAVTTGTFGMTNSVRVHHTTTFFKSLPGNFLKLKVECNGYADEAIVRFMPEATAEFDGSFDAVKFYGDVAEAPQLYTVGSIPLSINSLPETTTVPLGIHAGSAGNFTIATAQVNDFTNVSLEDTKTGVFTDILRNSYTFDYLPGDNEQRFILHFSAYGVADPANANPNIYALHKTVYIDLTDLSAGTAFIYNAAGQMVQSAQVSKGMNRISVPATGIYIVKVLNSQASFVRKVWIE